MDPLSAAAIAAVIAHQPRQVTARPGDTLSGLSLEHCGTAADYPGLAAASGIPDPDRIGAGQRVTIRCSTVGPRSRWHPAARTRAAYAPRHGGDREPDCDADDGYRGCHSAGYTARHARTASSGGGGGAYRGAPGSYEACVIARESGGQTQVMNSSGHYGLYQFDYGTWVSGGGRGADFGHASVAEQQQVFRAVYAARGTQPWTPSDGC